MFFFYLDFLIFKDFSKFYSIYILEVPKKGEYEQSNFTYSYYNDRFIFDFSRKRK